jgi:hypothetical protein
MTIMNEPVSCRFMSFDSIVLEDDEGVHIRDGKPQRRPISSHLFEGRTPDCAARP